MTRQPVQILPPHLVNRIAAGEVVERPASVVKELVENAIDAGATRIEVFAGAGGRTLRVADNGWGMSPEDARLAFYNHATSKIQVDSDLSRIETLGFRGEALASIAAIAKVTCLTRTADAPTGTRITLDALGEPLLTEAGCAPGTVLEVAELFYNTPARLKFLKRPQTELGHIQETVEYLALSHPEVQFLLTLNEKPVLKTRGSGDLQATIEDVFRLEKEGLTLLDVHQEDADFGLAVSGYTTPPGAFKNSKRWVVTFVNGRSVRCPVLQKAVESAYQSLIPEFKSPVSVLFLTLPPEEVDVNVHPTKREVRYTRSSTIFAFVRTALLKSLEGYGPTAFFPALEPTVPEGTPVMSAPTRDFSSSRMGEASYQRPASFGGGGGFSTPRTGGSQPRSPMESRAALGVYEQVTPTRLPLPEKPEFKVVGQLFNTYILLETRQGLMVVDQHIASERTFFEALTLNIRREDTAEGPEVQKLLAVAPLSLSPVQQTLLVDHQADFARLGFAYTLADATVTLRSVPIIYQGREPAGLFESLLRQLEETGSMKLDIDLMIATLACHSAVRAGDPLDNHEMTQVIQRWLDCRLPWTCPHGRPIAHTIKTEELNHFFHRPSLPVNA